MNDESGILLMTQCVLEEYMSAHGIHATYHTAINYNSAKELLETQRIDIIISDVNLKEAKNGFDVIDIAKTRYPSISCYMMTGMQEYEIADQLAKYDVKCLATPPSEEEIQEMLNGVVSLQIG